MAVKSNINTVVGCTYQVKKPETAEKLRRSRYTAFAQGNLNYLIATLYPDKRQPNDEQELAH